MMEIDIKEYINNNEDLINLIGRDKLYPLFSIEIDDISIVYNFKHLTGGYVKQSQLELKIITSDYDFVKVTEKYLLKILDNKEDKPYIAYGKTYFKSGLAGGGCLFRDDLQMFENTLIFTIKWKEI